MPSPFTALVALSAAVSALPSALDSRASYSSGNFSLYAYGTESGTEIGGFQVLYSDGYAYISDPSKINASSSYVTFNKDSTDSTVWLASGANGNTSWAGAALYVPRTHGGAVGFNTTSSSSSSAEDIVTTGFGFYGDTALRNDDDAGMLTLWYAVPDASSDGLWSLGWNASGAAGDDDYELVSLRRGAPSNA